jgi:L-fuculose-phosphate aldolase
VGHDALVLERHGSLTVGTSPLNAFYRTETLEQVARITYMLNQLGGGQTLPPHQVEKLMKIRQGMGLSRAADEADFCEACGVCHLEGQHTKSSEVNTNGAEANLVHTITERVLQELQK